MSAAPIDRCEAVPVAGKNGCFVMVDRQTGEPFDVGAKIMEDFETRAPVQSNAV